MMLRLALIGRPVSHSRSPAMMRAALDLLGYRRGLHGLPSGPRAPRRRGAGPRRARLRRRQRDAPTQVVGDRAPRAHRRHGAAHRRGANTLSREGGSLVGTNTDVEGLLGALRAHGADPRGGDVVVLGSGGAARAAAVGVATAGARSVTVLARNGLSASSVAEAAHHAGRCASHGHALGTPEAARARSKTPRRRSRPRRARNGRRRPHRRAARGRSARSPSARGRRAWGHGLRPRRHRVDGRRGRRGAARSRGRRGRDALRVRAPWRSVAGAAASLPST